MTVKLTDKVYNEGGAPVQGAVAQAILTNGTTSNIIATDLTDTKGVWAFDSSIAGHQADLADPAAGYWYDVRLNMGMQYRLRYGAIKAMMSMVYLAQTIILGATQLLDTSVAALRIPARTSDPGSPAAGQFVFRTDTKRLRVHDGTAWFNVPPGVEDGYLGATVSVSAAGTYVVPDTVSFVFVTIAGVTVTLPTATTTQRPIWVSPNFSISVTVNAVAGTVYGGTFHPVTGAVQNGLIQSSATSIESVTYKADGTNWRGI